MNALRSELVSFQRTIEALFILYGSSEESADICTIVRGYLELEDDDQTLMARALTCLPCPGKDRRRLMIRLRVLFGRIWLCRGQRQLETAPSVVTRKA